MAVSSVTADTTYTCPMHAQVRQLGPGNCPICGMALEPLMPSETEDGTHLSGVRRRFWIAIGFAIPVVLAAMLPHLPGFAVSHAMARGLRWLEFLLTVPIVVWAAADYYRRGWLGIVNRSPNMYTLIGLGVLVAFAYSVAATIVPNAFPEQMRDMHGMVGVYFEVAAVIVALAACRTELDG